MHGQGERAAQPSNTLDTGLACLVMLGRFHSVAASTEQMAYEYVAQGYLFGKAQIPLASRQLQLKDKSVRSKLDCLPQTSLPAIACAEDGRHFIIAQVDQDKILTQDPHAPRPLALSADELQVRQSGELILTRSKTFQPGEVSRFDFTWFISAVGAQINVAAKVSDKIVASGESETMPPSEVAVVKSIRVHDGQLVKAGDVLVELDTSMTGADIKRLKSDLLAAEVDSARATALIESIRTGKEPGSLTGHIPQAAPEQELAAQRWPQGQYQELRSSLEQIDAEVEQRSAEIQFTKATLASLQKTLPIARRLAEDYQQLLEQQYVPRHAYLEKQQALLDQERDMAVQQSRLAEVSASKKEAERRRQVLLAQTRRTMLDLQQQFEQKAASLVQELNKAEQRDHLMSLTAPVNGTVQHLVVHTVAGVVTAAQPLMVIAPSDQPVEAMFENKDIGFIRPGQPVTVKVETFTFTQYGTVEGEVATVSDDAIEDEKRGPIYSARIRLLKVAVAVHGQNVSLSPGMTVTAEVKTDRRRVIEYFLSPLQQHVDESLRER